MSVHYASSLLLVLKAPVVGQDLCLLSAIQRQNKRIASVAASLNPTLLVIILLGILNPEADFVTQALLYCCH